MNPTADRDQIRESVRRSAVLHLPHKQLIWEAQDKLGFRRSRCDPGNFLTRDPVLEVVFAVKVDAAGVFAVVTCFRCPVAVLGCSEAEVART